MSEKVYEMDDGYKKAAADLLELIKVRDEMVEVVKIAPPDKIREGQELIAVINKKIDRCETVLANEYEAEQKHRRALDEQERAFAEAKQMMAMSYVHVKYRLPDTLPAMEAIIFNDMTPEWIQDFRDQTAQIEAGDLVKIIAVQGETREQTEEFLKNYRAAESK